MLQASRSLTSELPFIMYLALTTTSHLAKTNKTIALTELVEAKCSLHLTKKHSDLLRQLKILLRMSIFS